MTLAQGIVWAAVILVFGIPALALAGFVLWGMLYGAACLWAKIEWRIRGGR